MSEVSHPYGKEMQDEFSAQKNHSYKVERGMTGLLVHQETQPWKSLQKQKTFERENNRKCCMTRFQRLLVC